MFGVYQHMNYIYIYIYKLGVGYDVCLLYKVKQETIYTGEVSPILHPQSVNKDSTESPRRMSEMFTF